MRLCGISSHFWLLSPSIRQVTHALLTRPPLETDQIRRSLNEMFPVRLACVKHAASVHPEPGSNSLIKCLIPVRQHLAIFPFYCYKKFILSNLFIKNFRESYVFHCLVIKVLCFSLPFDSSFTLSYSSMYVKHFFQVFLRHFLMICRSFKRLVYSITSSIPCQQLFSFFQNFLNCVFKRINSL